MTSCEALEHELTVLGQTLFQKQRELAVILLQQLGGAMTTTERQRVSAELAAIEKRITRRETEERG